MLTALALMVLGVASAGPRAWGYGGVGLVTVALGVAALRVARAAGGAPPPEFLAVNGGLLALGLGLVGVGLVRASAARSRSVLAGLISGTAGVALGAAAVASLGLGAGGAVRGFAVAAVVTLLGGGAVALEGRLRLADRVARRAAPEPALAPAPLPLLLLAAGALLAALGPGIGLVFLGAMLSAIAAWRAVTPEHRLWPVAPALVVLLLAVALRLFDDISGPEGLAIAAIPALPLSQAAEVLLAPLVLGSAWALAGLWPLRQPASGSLTAPIGALLLVRVAAPALPAGLEHWRALAFPIVVAGMWYGSLLGRMTSVVIGGALLGLASAGPGGIAGAWWLLACAPALELLRHRSPASVERRAIVTAIIALAAAWGGLQVLEAGLRAQVVWTACAAGAAAVALARRSRVDPSTGRDHIPAS